MVENNRVNLITTSLVLEDKILTEYPYSLFPDEQYHVIGKEEDRIVIFSSLNKGELLPYLKYVDSELPLKDCYEVRDSEGEFIKTRIEGQTLVKQGKMKKILRGGF